MCFDWLNWHLTHPPSSQILASDKMSNAGAMGMMHEVRRARAAPLLAPSRRLESAPTLSGSWSFALRRDTSQLLTDPSPPHPHQGYFVGRKELASWIQQHFQPNFNKVEDCASGVVYCQIVDSIYPGLVPMAKVKRDAKTEVDFIHNFKILQTAFSKKKIDRYIEVDKLTKRSFQYNMEFLQFMKCYWDMHAPNGAGFDSAASVENGPPNGEPTPEKAPVQKAVKQQPEKKIEGGAKRASSARKPEAPTVAAAPTAGLAAASSEQQRQLALEVTELKMSVENLERERDFYYSKLREVEVLCQQHEGHETPFLKQVLDILYKTDDADEFVAPDESEALGVQ